ncbi:hypothetical protein [Streptomyces hoynatensis]|uniref:Asp23/Gls24 family envelope stress response protein n=1 Tax=Streptomyces hoynatensis TaxID=1141874 RepID=A0A3A9Z5A1_9ACTN|nr:hypothetical protein [Streptomyces hoynatensis]RKN42457.1 hypothetical protein D7294_13705 [Streptomyces hoynatensis]
METVIPPGERGATRIAERVVAKLAAQAAREALRSEPDGPPLPPGTGGWAEATAQVSRPPGTAGAGLAGVRVAVELGYPTDIAARCTAVRHHVTRRLRELAGMDTSHVTVAVERLRSDHFGGESQGRVW